MLCLLVGGWNVERSSVVIMLPIYIFGRFPLKIQYIVSSLSIVSSQQKHVGEENIYLSKHAHKLKFVDYLNVSQKYSLVLTSTGN